MAGRLSSSVFVGRRAQLEAISSALERAETGETVHLLVAGEAGVGKTRLASEATRTARDRGFLVLRGECVNLGGSSLPYGPIVEALRGLVSELDPADLAGVAGTGAADLARLVPAFATGRSAAPAQSEWVQSRLFEALLGLFERLARRRPVLLVLEDLHWADAATREAIDFLVRTLREAPVALLATFRSDELHRRHPLLPWLAELERGGRVERLELGRLDRTELTAMLTAIRGVQPRAELIDEVFKRSDGNPFFAEELLAAGQGDGAGSRLPPTLREILLAHVASVPEPAAPVLGMAAVAGRRVDHDLLAQVADLPESRLLEGLRAAIAGHLLVVETERGQERYAFRHALVQEAVYEDLLPGERRSLHRAFAEALDRQAPGSGASEAGHWAELAHHWAAAREEPRAFAASLRAAGAAIAAFASDAALHAYEHALELWDGLPEPEEAAGFDRVELLRRAGRAAYLAANYRRSVAHRREAIARADPAVDPVRAGILREELGRALYVLGEPTASLEAYRDAVATIPAEPPTAERARAVSGLGQILMLLGRYAESAGLCEEARDMARVVGARAQEGHALNTLGLDRALLGECSSGIALLEEALAIAREERNADDIGRAFVNLTEALDSCGRTGAALDLTAEGIREAEEVGIGHSYGHYVRMGGVAFAYAVGRWDEAARLLDEATGRAPSGTGPEMYRLANSLGLLVGRGMFDLADAGLEKALAFLDVVQVTEFVGPVHGASAERALWRQAPGVALEIVERGLERLASTDDRAETSELCRIGAWAAADRAEEARATRDEPALRDARDRLGRLRARHERIRPGLPDHLAADRETLEAEGRRLDGTGDPDVWRRVAERWAALGRPYLEAYARWREGEAAIGAADRAAAADALRRSQAIAAELGAAPLRDAVEGLARRARLVLAPAEAEEGQPEPPTPADPFGLTPREREVLLLLADGRTNRQIAEHLFISESTAGVHVSNILGKLGVSSRVEAAGIAFRLRLVPAEPDEPGGPAGFPGQA